MRRIAQQQLIKIGFYLFYYTFHILFYNDFFLIHLLVIFVIFACRQSHSNYVFFFHLSFSDLNTCFPLAFPSFIKYILYDLNCFCVYCLSRATIKKKTGRQTKQSLTWTLCVRLNERKEKMIRMKNIMETENSNNLEHNHTQNHKNCFNSPLKRLSAIFSFLTSFLLFFCCSDHF